MKSGTAFRGLSWFERRFDTKDTKDTKVRRVFPLGKVLVLAGLGVAGLGLLITLALAFFRRRPRAIKSDRWITRMAHERRMIEPFVDDQVREGVISYGVS